MLSPEVGKLPDPLYDAQWIVLRKNSNRTVQFVAARQHLLRPSRKRFIKEGIGNGLVDHARTRVKRGVDPVRTEGCLGKKPWIVVAVISPMRGAAASSCARSALPQGIERIPESAGGSLPWRSSSIVQRIRASSSLAAGSGEGDRSNLCGINSRSRSSSPTRAAINDVLRGASRGLDQYVGSRNR